MTIRLGNMGSVYVGGKSALLLVFLAVLGLLLIPARRLAADGEVGGDTVDECDRETGGTGPGKQCFSNDAPEGCTELSLIVDPITISENGGVTTCTVTLVNCDANPNGCSIAVTVQNADPDDHEARATLSTTWVNIAPNTFSGTFTLTAIDDAYPNDDRTVMVTVSASDTSIYAHGQVIIENDDHPSFSLSLTRSTISEADGSEASQATLTCTQAAPASGLIVTLTSSDTTEATVPATVTIPAGQSSTTFHIAAVDDDIAATDDGSWNDDAKVTVTITATATHYVDGTVELDVCDDSLTWDVSFPVELSSTNLLLSNEGCNVATIAITRRAPLDRPLTIDIQNTEADLRDSIPSELTFIAGQATAEFDITIDPSVIYTERLYDWIYLF